MSFYPGIKDGSKLNLVVRKTTQESSDEKSPAVQKYGTALLRESVSKILKKYYSQTETESITNELVKELRTKVNNLSFDDLERLATALLQDQENIV